jgi:putative ABC transport system substrate-binding protein
MRRRLGALLLLTPVLLIAIGWTAESWGQAKLPRVGIVANRIQDPMFEVAERALASRGWINGKTVALEYRITGGDAVRIANATTELVGLKVDVLYCWSAPALRAAYAATHTIPIVAIDLTTDPVAAGYAESYRHPGRNVTGAFLDAPGIAAKWLELLKTIVPRLSRVAVVWDPAPGQVHLRAVQGAARSLGVEIQVLEVHKPEDIEKAFAAFRDRTQAAILLPAPLLYANNATSAAVAKKRRVPAIGLWREFTEAGGAISYGPYQPENIERSAALVASILGGSKPGDLPIERSTKFEFILNLKTIEALGITIPQSVLLQADEVIR